MQEFAQKLIKTNGVHPIAHARHPKMPGQTHDANPLARKQAMGNQAIQRMLRSGTIQAKLTVNEPGDKYEQEADRIAEQVMSMPEPVALGQEDRIQRKCSECDDEVQRQPEEEDEEERVQTKPIAEQITPFIQRQMEPEEEEEEPVQAKSGEQLRRQDVLDEVEKEMVLKKGPSGGGHHICPGIEVQIRSLQGNGQPMSQQLRSFFEPRFRQDLSQVRVHADTKATNMADQLNASAFTFGQNLVFRHGQFAPETVAGRLLLAHELTHFVQQKGRISSENFSLAINRKKGMTDIKPKISGANGPLSLSEEKLLKKWIMNGNINIPGYRPIELTDNHDSNKWLLAQGIISYRSKAPVQSSQIFRPGIDPEISDLMQGPINRLYNEVVPQKKTNLTDFEEKTLKNSLNDGKANSEALIGEPSHDLDVLTRYLLFKRTGLKVKSASSSPLNFPEITQDDPQYWVLRNGSIKRGYEEWTERLRAKLPKGDVIRGNPGESRDVAMRRLNWLYRSYRILDWGKWYNENIDRRVHFLGAEVIYGMHRSAVNALKEAEMQLGFPESYPEYPKKAIGGGYNVRGWNGKLGTHDFGMAIDIYPKSNIEILGSRGWMGSEAGRDRVAAITILTSSYFSLSTFAKDPQKERIAKATEAEKIKLEVKKAINEEIDLVDRYTNKNDETNWEIHLDDLLNRASKLDAYPKVLWQIQQKKYKTGQEQRIIWRAFLKNLLPHLVDREFYNIPPEVVQALGDRTRPPALRFNWMPFHHFELAGWKDTLKSQGIRFPK